MRKSIILLYISFTLLVILQVLFYIFEGISLRGYWSDKVLVWLWLIATVIIVIKEIKKRITKIYLAGLGTILLLSIIPFGIPILLFCTFVTASDRDFVVRVNDNVRIQKVFGSPMVGYRIQVTVEKAFYERMVAEMPGGIDVADTTYELEAATGFSIKSYGGGSALLIIQFPKGDFKKMIHY